MAAEPRRLIGLRLALDALGVPPTTAAFQDRLTLQKATYLAQEAGLNLGYRYNWYLKGPYSPELTRDYFRLGEAPEGVSGYRLNENYLTRLQEVASILKPPPRSNLHASEWLELLASLHYLIKKLKKSPEAATTVIGRLKPHLVDHVDEALDSLREASLL